LKESDELRNQLMNETSEEKIKAIIYKFIVKPDMDKKLKKEKPQSIVQDISLFLKSNENFVQSFVEMHTAEQVKLQKEIIKEKMKHVPLAQKEDFWAKKWIKGAKNHIKEFKVPELPIPKLPPMPSSHSVKPPDIIAEAPANLDIEHEIAPPKVQSLLEPIDEQLIESTPPSEKSAKNPY
jgi:hypothetical protein